MIFGGSGHLLSPYIRIQDPGWLSGGMTILRYTSETHLTITIYFWIPGFLMTFQVGYDHPSSKPTNQYVDPMGSEFFSFFFQVWGLTWIANKRRRKWSGLDLRKRGVNFFPRGVEGRQVVWTRMQQKVMLSKNGWWIFNLSEDVAKCIRYVMFPKNRGTPKSSNLKNIGFLLLWTHPFWDISPYFWKQHPTSYPEACGALRDGFPWHPKKTHLAPKLEGPGWYIMGLELPTSTGFSRRSSGCHQQVCKLISTILLGGFRHIKIPLRLEVFFWWREKGPPNRHPNAQSKSGPRSQIEQWKLQSDRWPVIFLLTKPSASWIFWWRIGWIVYTARKWLRLWWPPLKRGLVSGNRHVRLCAHENPCWIRMVARVLLVGS